VSSTVAVPLADGRWLVLEWETFTGALQRGAKFGFNGTAAAGGPAPTERLVNSAELAELLGCNDTLVEQMARDGRIPAVRIGRLLRFEPAAVLAALRATTKDGNYTHE
jgi:excisionase family DNA binding protein